MSKKGKGSSANVLRRSNKAPTRLEDQEYYLVQFVDDGILEIVTVKDLKTSEDGRREARYGDSYYLCVVVFRSGDKEEVMKRKEAMLKLQKPTKQTKKKNAGNGLKENKNKENKEELTKERGQLAKKKDKEEVARKKAEREKKQAEKEKAMEEKARQKAQKEKERAALMERDNRLLSEMATLESNLRSSGACEASEPPPSDGEDSVILEQGLDECFNDNDIVSECSRQYLNHTPSNTMALTPESRTSHLDHSGAKVVNSAPPLLVPNQASDYNSRQPFQPRQIMNQNSDCYSQTPRSTIGGKRPRSWTNVSSQPEATRPAVGGKRPRASFHLLPEEDDTCTKCVEYKQLIESKDAEISQLKAQVNGHFQELPRPGKMPQFIATRFKLVELSKGRGVYAYEDNITTAKSKNSPTSAACFLLSCFYKNEELVGRNLTGANAKQGLDADIVASILDFAVKEGGKASTVRQALRNKISSITTRANGWQPGRKVP